VNCFLPFGGILAPLPWILISTLSSRFRDLSAKPCVYFGAEGAMSRPSVRAGARKAHRCCCPPHPRRQGLSRPDYPDRFRIWISGQVRRVTKVIRREMRRRAAVEPVIGHLKDDHRMRRNYLKGRDGDRINAVLAAAGYNFSLLLRWFEELLRVLLLIICRSRAPRLLLG
jgi:DDE family transposase